MPWSKEQIEKFEQEHGGRDKRVAVGQAYYYPDGASREFDGNGVMAEPSPDDFERWRTIEIYWVTRERLASEDFETRRRSIIRSLDSGNGSMTKENVEKELEPLRAEVRKAQSLLLRTRKKLVRCAPAAWAERFLPDLYREYQDSRKTPEDREREAARERNRSEALATANAIKV